MSPRSLEKMPSFLEFLRVLWSSSEFLGAPRAPQVPWISLKLLGVPRVLSSFSEEILGALGLWCLNPCYYIQRAFLDDEQRSYYSSSLNPVIVVSCGVVLPSYQLLHQTKCPNTTFCNFYQSYISLLLDVIQGSSSNSFQSPLSDIRYHFCLLIICCRVL